jgi:2'-deoxymugineic-acid 2'-dioxygenase/mugineic-acid 3-dioxygenase
MASTTLNLTPVHAPSIPDCFLLPADQLRPATATVSLPVVDMSRDRDEVRRAILDSGKEYGFIQASFAFCSIDRSINQEIDLNNA